MKLVLASIRAGFIVLLLLVFFSVVMPLAPAAERLGWRISSPASRIFCRLLLVLLRVEVEVTRSVGVPGARLVVANHVSWIDVLAFGSVEPFCFVAKREIASWPVVSAFAAAQGTVFIDRCRRRCIPKVNSDMAERLLSGRSVILVPRGNHTRWNGARAISHVALGKL